MNQKYKELRLAYYRLWQQVNLAYEEWAKEHGLTLSELLILITIWEREEGMAQKEVMKRSQLPKQTVSMIVNAMVKKGWLRLEPDEKDLRSKKVLITEDGLLHFRPLIDELEQADLAGFEAVGLKETEEMNQAMERFIHGFRGGKQ